MTEALPYTIAFTPAARRRLDKLPLPAASALYEHLTGPVASNPYRLSKPLDAPFEDVRSTRRGDYRALYIIDDHDRIVTVLAVAHRREVYRPQ
jgi:mRNA interferase RelE/StbE